MLLDIAPELTSHIYSFLPLEDMYRIREASKASQAIAERSIWDHIAREEHVTLRLGEKDSNVKINLYGHSFDAKNRVIEFRPSQMEPISLADRLASSGDIILRTFQLWFTGWKHHDLLDSHNPLFEAAMSSMNRTENANVLFHETYNPVHEKIYLLPSVHDIGQQGRTRYVGDSEMVLALYYTAKGSNLSEFYSRTTTGQSSITALSPPPERSANIVSLRVSLSWIMSGIKPNGCPIELYAAYRQHLRDTLSMHHAFTYDPHCEQVLEWLVSEQAEKGIVPSNLITFLKEHTHESLSRQAEIQRLLESAGVDSNVLWKYGFAKRWLAGKGAFVSEDVVRRIQTLEERWQKERQSLMRRLARAKANKD
jgi:hypothetical protein